MDRNHTAAEILVSARRRQKLTQAQLAIRAGISPSTVSLAERANLISRNTAEKLAAALGMRGEDLLP